MPINVIGPITRSYCGYHWMSPTRGWVHCELGIGHDNRHVNGHSWVAVGSEWIINSYWEG